MTFSSIITQANQYFEQGDYAQAARSYEQAIILQPEERFAYWYLGLALLLQGEEDEAQMCWAFALDESEEHFAELIQILRTEAQRQQLLLSPENLHNAWAIAQYLRELVPNDSQNLFELIQLSIQLEILVEEDASVETAIANLQERNYEPNLETAEIYFNILQLLLEKYPHYRSTVQLVKACLDSDLFSSERIINLLLQKVNIFISQLPALLCIPYFEICYEFNPNHLAVVANLANLYQEVGRNLESIGFARRISELSPQLVDRIAANYLTTRGLMQAGGKWNEAISAYNIYQESVRSLMESPESVDINHILSISVTGAFCLYFGDRPKETHAFFNQLGKFCQSQIRQHFQPKLQSAFSHASRVIQELPLKRKLRIGYISECLRRHSVGWIARWLFMHSDREQFEIYGYSLIRTDDNVQQIIAAHCTEFRYLSLTDSIDHIAQQIYSDRIDILVDLDSLTSNHIYAVMSLRPAPIQITWLGSDASGVPAVDYFIADPYVLDQSAEDCYAAKIWRLPQTYVAIDGFETDIPNLRREDLNIPPDAIIYLSAQAAYKRHPETAHLQLQILHAVPNSYLLIKGGGDPDSLRDFFEGITKAENVDCDRLRFLPAVASEEIHRANLKIADVVLDTYPYNGATTTLETLWMGIPLVTRVGEQFSARNSYTMMVNTGISEGIAWTDREYIEWGIRLGTDEKLRSQIAWQLKASRQTAPLWNARLFAQEMAKAYWQMWEIYVESLKS